MKKNYTSIVIPEENSPSLFLVLEGEHYEWYDDDPLLNGTARKLNLEDYILNELGVDSPSKANPIKVRMRAASIDRSIPFDVSLPSKIRQGQMTRHFVDYDGNVVDIIEARNPAPGFPFNGVVLNGRGEMIGMRHYSHSGACDDGEDNHAIFAVDGSAVFESAKDDREADTEGLE